MRPDTVSAALRSDVRFGAAFGLLSAGFGEDFFFEGNDSVYQEGEKLSAVGVSFSAPPRSYISNVILVPVQKIYFTISRCH